MERRGEIVLSARLLADMLRRMDSETVEIDCDEKNLTAIRGGRTEYTILAIPSEDLPLPCPPSATPRRWPSPKTT